MLVILASGVDEGVLVVVLAVFTKISIVECRVRLTSGLSKKSVTSLGAHSLHRCCYTVQCIMWCANGKHGSQCVMFVDCEQNKLFFGHSAFSVHIVMLPIKIASNQHW